MPRHEPGFDQGRAALDVALVELLPGAPLVPATRAEFLALDPDGPLLTELRVRLGELGYPLPEKVETAAGLEAVLRRFEREAKLEETGWLDGACWDELHDLVAYDARLQLDTWLRPDQQWPPAFRRAVLFRLERLGHHAGPELGLAPRQSVAEAALDAFLADCLAWNWRTAGATQREALALLFDHDELLRIATSDDVDDVDDGFLGSAGGEEGPQRARERLLIAEHALSGWAAEPDLASEAAMELGGFLGDEDRDDSRSERALASDTLEALDALVTQHGERVQQAVDELRAKGRAGGLWDGIRAAHRWLAGWVRKIGEGLRDLAQVSRPVLRQAARALHALGGRALGTVRAALSVMSAIGRGVISARAHSRIERRPDGDMALFLLTGAPKRELRAARRDLERWGRDHAVACKVVAIVVQTVVNLASGPVGWVVLIVRVVRALWEADLLDVDLGARRRRRASA